MFKKAFLVAVLFDVFSAESVYAWGALGHQVICDIAWRDSSPATQQRLSATAKRMGYRTFASSCVWADHMRSQQRYDYLQPLHYMNVARAAYSVRSSSCLMGSAGKPQCVLTAIEYYLQRHNNTSLSQRQRDEALLLAAHFLGDLHQPLHVSYADDRGGNTIRLRFSNDFLSLHQWSDNRVLTCANAQNDGNGKTRVQWRDWGKKLYLQHRAAQSQNRTSQSQNRSTQSFGTDTLTLWADESLSITRQIYAHIHKSSFTDDACARYSPIAQQRLVVAGFRLAQLLAP